jgi:hypothetical protein
MKGIAMSDLYKSPLGILFLVLEFASLLLMAYSFDKVFDNGWQAGLLLAGVIIMMLLGLMFAVVADTWIGTTIAIALAFAITSPIFYYVWSAVGWPAGGFAIISVTHAGLRSWRKEAEGG